ncbi:hypothetical protein B0H13DRAFT_1619320 [Mycena leptocephala]|nr:hypothetical protein B0H13DRAFT_1619320 [Mycena leptocephala]
MAGGFVPPRSSCLSDTISCSDPKLILDDKGRIIGVLLGTPEDPEWPEVIKDAIKELLRARRRAKQYGSWNPGSTFHRRGWYLPLTCGISFGGGQIVSPVPPHPHSMLTAVCSDQETSFTNIANFFVGGLAFYAPKLYRFLCDTLRGIFERQPALAHNFVNSVFPAAAFNCGPDAFTIEHLDWLNLSHGLCGITCGGDFNPILGDHIHTRLLIEFPGGASILLPSGCVDHGNTPIQPGESRHSFTQYAAGAFSVGQLMVINLRNLF